jgi:hypothetical protein
VAEIGAGALWLIGSSGLQAMRLAYSIIDKITALSESQLPIQRIEQAVNFAFATQTF